MIDDYTTLLEAIKKRGLQVLHIHDISGILASAGFSIEPLNIVEFCSEKFACKLLRTDAKLSLIMP